MTSVRDVVTELAVKDTSGFRASYVAERTGRPVADVQAELVTMVDAGDLTLQFQVVDPNDGAILVRFGRNDPLPIGEAVEREDGDYFTLRKRHVLVAYVPTKALVTRLLQDATAGKGHARLRAPRWLARSVREIASRRHRHSSSTITTTWLGTL